ncbi:PepSY-associated TM helix domain-containing protein [Methylomicrobium sp. Wu6]|uniref:PepSY-associated TM helix domain-containing protein n=1 Tax=Methylomicrobium sp. Wu6 TaxID=3107928 RepID=UPI002DD66564|nr:PepSY-associated TM helix domain-containing protein [Methylomicrobium sp. Wu6]MEC4748541.1 PepSY-associated TM helix domain-containing protein [Methylomicrobium sp. Wu6]
MSFAIIKARRGRAAWLKLHLLLALGAGFLFALLGLTGSLSIYREDIDELLNPRLAIDEPSGDYQTLDKIITAVRSAHPDRYGAWTLEMPRSPHGMITAWFDKPRESYFEWYAPLMVSVNPYTAEVVASRFWGATFATWLLDLHSHLHLGLSGRNTVGVLGLLLMLSAGSGLVLWWPGVKGIIKALTIRRHSGMLRFATDLHRMTGFLIAMALMMLASTGFLLSYPKTLEKLTGTAGMGHGEDDRTIISTAVPNNHPLGLEGAEFIARAPFSRAELRRITTPVGDSGVFEIHFRQEYEINQRHPFTTVWVDRWSGHIQKVRDPAKFSAGQTIATWIWPLHSGEALGATGRLLWFLAGQALFFLYLSGLFRWLCRRGAIADRPVNLTPLKDTGFRVMTRAYRLSLMIWRLSIKGGRKALPQAAALWRALTRLLLTVKRSLRN